MNESYTIQAIKNLPDGTQQRVELKGMFAEGDENRPGPRILFFEVVSEGVVETQAV